ncbi:MAG: segregation/condensation protein A [Candidatus Aenigmarchaeota archaeon]|nr:segregation/condensation protein A [Candidatus Aenigmarchaeota archaeon]
MIDDAKLIMTIIGGHDLQDVLAAITVDEGLDPLDIDISRLADGFMKYLEKMRQFDFRVPGRFILVAAILLRMKCETMLAEEVEEKGITGETIPPLDISNVPQLTPPMMRKPTRRVTLAELVNALSKAVEFRERKEERKIRLHERVEKFIEPEEDIEARITRIYNRIVGRGNVMSFREIVPDWTRKGIVEAFMAMLYLMSRGKIYCEQEEMFADIKIRLME